MNLSLVLLYIHLGLIPDLCFIANILLLTSNGFVKKLWVCFYEILYLHVEFVNEVIFILRSIKDPQGDTKCEFLLPDNTSMFHFFYFLNSIKPLNIMSRLSVTSGREKMQ